MKEVNYISEIKLSSKSAYKHHVLKMCNAFAKQNKTNLFIYQNDDNFEKVKKNHLIKNHFELFPFKKVKKVNFFYRLKYAFFIKKKINKNSLIISRSILTSLFLNCSGIENILELHHPPIGFTKYLFFALRIFKLDKRIKYIVISKNLKKYLNLKNALVLDDAIDIEDFMISTNQRIKYDFSYVGSLFDGKGIEIIDFLSKNFREKNFYIFGDLNTLNENKKKILKRNNLFFMGKVEYRKIPEILHLSRFLLMPYLDNVKVNSNNLDVAKFMSPLKLFDYLAAGKIIIATKLEVYSHILKNRVNSILINGNNQNVWRERIKDLINNEKKYLKLGINAKNLSKNFSWSRRARKILKYHND